MAIKLSKRELDIWKHTVEAEHIYGISALPKDKEMLVYYDDDGLTFISGNAVFGVGYDVISDIGVKTETEVQRQLVSSAGGAVAGAMLFGAAGAAVGGRVKEKNLATSTDYVLISYINGDKFDYICYKPRCGATKWIDEHNKQALSKSEVKDKMYISDFSGNAKIDKAVSRYKPSVEKATEVKAVIEKNKRIFERNIRHSTNMFLFVIAMIFLTIVILIFLSAMSR